MSVPSCSVYTAVGVVVEHMKMGQRRRFDVPTLTAVFASSSDARLPPCLLLMLILLLLLGGRIMALMGRGGTPKGEPGGVFVILSPSLSPLLSISLRSC